MTPDVDGYTSSALLYMFLVNECNYDKKKIKIFIHENKEHGLGDEKVFKAIKKSDVDFMIIADASTNDTKEIKELMKMNKRVLLLDHHNLEDDNMKTKYQNQKGELIGVIVNNQINEYSTCLSGVGVVYKLLVALTETEMDKYLDIVAIGSVADSMTLNDLELRYIVDKGLNNVYNELIKEYVLDSSLSDKLTPMDVSFNIANKMNGLIRYGNKKEKEDLFKALVGESDKIEYKPRKSKNNPNPQVEMQSLQKAMVRISKSVKSKQDKAKKECANLCKIHIEENNLNDNKCIVIIDKENEFTNKKITGLIAMTLSDVYKKSVVLLSKSKDDFSGSIRGYGVDNLKEVLESTEICEVMGHNNSAGIKVLNKDINRFVKRVNKAFEDVEVREACVNVDCKIDVKNIKTKDMNDILEMKSIWHQHCQAPLFLIEDFEINSKDIRNPYPTLIAFKINGIECKKEFCSGDFRKALTHEEDVKFGKPILKCNLIVKIGYDDYGKQPCFILEDAESVVIDNKKSSKPTKNAPF